MLVLVLRICLLYVSGKKYCIKLFIFYKIEWGFCFFFNGLDLFEIYKIGYVGSILGLFFFIYVN